MPEKKDTKKKPSKPNKNSVYPDIYDPVKRQTPLRPGHSPDLELSGKPTKLVRELLKQVSPNSEQPTKYQRAKDWDHLIHGLNDSDSIPLPNRIAGAVIRRARELGYVVRSRKIDDEYVELWYGGYDGQPQARNVKKKK